MDDMKFKNSTILLTVILGASLVASCGSGNDALESDAYMQTMPQTSQIEQTQAVQSAVTETSAPETSVPESAETSVTAETELSEPDTKAPFFLKINRDIWILTGSEFDINDYISYIDDTDPNVTLTVSGDVDTSTEGNYPLAITLTDASGNTTNDSVTVNVMNPVTPAEGETVTSTESTVHETTSFSDFVAAYPGDAYYGIDVSKWQGDIDFDAVTAAGCDFVVIRAGYSSGGEFTEDEYFAANIEGASAAGLKIGVYVYSSDNNEEDVRALADRLIDMTSGYQISLPFVFDWESFGKFQIYQMSIKDLNNLYRAFKDQITSNGYSSMLYSSKYYLDEIWDDDLSSVWLAHYTSMTDYDGIFLMWQQSCTGSIDGINADVDMDIYYGSFE